MGKDKLPDMAMIRAIAKTISGVLKRGDLWVPPSTVPVGTTRKEVLPVLESGGLAAGRDFFLAFAPERTAEGNALEELRVLPQIVGGFDATSVEMHGAIVRRNHQHHRRGRLARIRRNGEADEQYLPRPGLLVRQ